MSRPQILLTNRIPSSVVARLEALGDLDRFSPEGVDVMPHDELVARVVGKQVLMCLITDRVDRAVLESGSDLKLVANVGVGFNNIDVAVQTGADAIRDALYRQEV